MTTGPSLLASLAAAATMWLTPATAERPATPTLAGVVQASLERHPEQALSGVIRRQGDAIRQQADSLLAADAAVSLHHETDAATESDGFRNWEGGVAMPLWLPGQRDARRGVAEATLREADATRRVQHWRVAGEVRELLWSLKIAAARVELADRAVHSAGTLQHDVEKRVTAGELARSDLILAQKETLSREITLASAQSEHERLAMEYHTLTGLTLVPTDIAETAAREDSIDDDHPALAIARTERERGRAERDQAHTEKRASPVLSLGGKSERPGSGASYDTALTMEISLPLGLRSQAATRTARAERKLTEADAALLRVRRELENALNRSRLEIQRATRAEALAQQQRYLAAERLRLTRRSFELGESDLFVLLQARAEALSSERDFQLRHLEGGRARARLNQALGVLPE